MHDGSIATLEEVLEHYAAGGRVITDAPSAGDGRQSPAKSSFVRGFSFAAGEKEALLAVWPRLQRAPARGEGQAQAEQ